MRAAMAILMAAAAMLAAPAAASAGTGDPRPFGHECTAENGVRFCPTTSLAERVPSWDGVPLDVDVTLPPTGDGPWPTITILHGVGQTKTAFETTSPEGPRPDTRQGSIIYHYNNNFYARRGFAVVNATARGWGNSCGEPSSRTSPGCDRGWIHLADQRYEVRDAQHLLGLLVDQGIAHPTRLGATGISYGGGTSVQMAFLRDRIRLPDGRFTRWRSPNGVPMRLTAAWPRWQWSDLFESLVRNGRFLDFRNSTIDDGARPIGIELQSYVIDLLTLTEIDAFIAPEDADPSADLIAWDRALNRGEPYGPYVAGVARELRRFKSAVGLFGHRPSPLLLQNGFTDDLFPAEEALRVYNFLRSRDRRAPVAMQLGDLGHGRAQNKVNTNRSFNNQGARFFDAHLRGRDRPPAPGNVRVFSQTCPPDAPAGGPFDAPSWTALRHGAWHIRSSSRRQTVTSTGGNRAIGDALNPATGTGTCQPFPSRRSRGTAVYERVSPGFTMLGLPTVRARIRTRGPFGQLDARLWHIRRDGRQILVARSGYRLRPNQTGTVTFQLQGGAYRFPRGERVKLELLGRDSPFLRPSNGRFEIRVDSLLAELPTGERPNARRDITCPRFGASDCRLRRDRGGRGGGGGGGGRPPFTG